MRAGSLAGLAVAVLVVLICVANIVFAVLDGGAVPEILLWVFGVLIGAAGIVVFVRRLRSE